MNYQLYQVNGKTLDLSISTPMRVHAENPKNFFQVIIDQINQNLYQKYLPDKNKKATIIDVGANVGLFSLHVAIPGWEVHSFEPTGHFGDIYNSANYGQEGIIKWNQLAVFSYDGETEFGYCEFNSTMNCIGGWDGHIKVNCIRLSTYIVQNKLEQVDFVKLDAEGAEPAILDELMQHPGIMQRIKTLFIEFHGQKQANRANYKTAMEAQGYLTEEIGDDTLVCISKKINEIIPANYDELPIKDLTYNSDKIMETAKSIFGEIRENIKILEKNLPVQEEVDSDDFLNGCLEKEMTKNITNILRNALTTALNYEDEILTGEQKKTLTTAKCKEYALDVICNKHVPDIEKLFNDNKGSTFKITIKGKSIIVPVDGFVVEKL